MKSCRKCGADKSLSDFHKDANLPDGLRHICKACACKISRDNRAKNIEARRAYDRERAKDPARKAADYEATKRKRRRNPMRARAHSAVANAIRRGLLIPEPCERCNTTPTDAHHDDYSRPLKVRWLCRQCHVEHHAHARNTTL